MTNKKINYNDLFDFLKVFLFMKAREYIIIEHLFAFEYLIHHRHSIFNVVVSFMTEKVLSISDERKRRLRKSL